MMYLQYLFMICLWTVDIIHFTP